MPGSPPATVVIPTRDRADYLDVALHSIVPQAADQDADVLVVSDGPDPQARGVAERHGVEHLALPRATGANAARNAGVAAARASLIVFVDDDVEALPGWLEALIRGAEEASEDDVFGGPILPRLEGGGPHACGLEPPPITTLDAGTLDRAIPLVWSANMAIRVRAFERVGGFDESIRGRGEEEDWQRRYKQAGGQIRYVAGAPVIHRRTPEDATLRRLAGAQYRLGRSARRYDVRKGTAPSLAGELRVLAGSGWHTARRRCAYGIVFGAHAAGRIREAIVESGR